MSDDIYTILERMKALDNHVAPILPVRETRELDPQQKSVHQLPRLFMPKSINVLSNKDDPQHPAKNYFVGENNDDIKISKNSRFKENDKVQVPHLGKMVSGTVVRFDQGDDPAWPFYVVDVGEYESIKVPHQKVRPLKDVAEQIGEGKNVGEDKLTQVKKGLTDYLKDLEDIKTDSDLKDKEQDQTDSELQDKEKALDLALHQSHPVKSVTMQNGNVCEVHGNEHEGFCIRHKQKEMPSRFSNIDEALMAIEMYNARMRESLLTADYMEEK